MESLAIYDQPHAEWLGDIGAHRVPLKDVPESEECFVVHLTNWLTKESD